MNDPEDDKPELALIAGPTASGKTALALAVAQRRPVTIINADSAQVYRDLPILSAQPSAAEQAAAPHRLFGTLDGAEAGSAARWAADAREAIDEAHTAGRLPLLVGGTGLYLGTLLDGIAPVPPVDPAIRVAVRALPVAEAQARLVEADPAMAAALAPGDSARIARALEVMLSSGRSIAAWRRERTGGIGAAVRLRPLILLPERTWLHQRCDDRFAAMLESGAVAEVERLLARGLPPEQPVLRAIGVAAIAAWLTGACDRDAMLAAGQRATRRYAKRQYTWFRNQPPGHWPRHSPAEDCSIDRLIDILLL